MSTFTENRSRNAEQWRRHIERADASSEPLSAYCRSEGLSLPSMNYWRKKLREERQRLPTVISNARPASAFIPIEVTSSLGTTTLTSRNPILPDARWVADLILHLSSGGGFR